MLAVIDGAVNASLSAIICLILLVSAVFKSVGVSAIIAFSHSGSASHSAVVVAVLDPIRAIS